jgi:hypothetical protein
VVSLPEGKKRFVTTGLIALLRSPSDLLASDQATILTVDARGQIEEGRWIASTNNTTEMDIELKRGKGNAYRYSGTYKGKALSGNFKIQTGQVRCTRSLPSRSGSRRNARSRSPCKATVLVTIRRGRRRCKLRNERTTRRISCTSAMVTWKPLDWLTRRDACVKARWRWARSPSS